MANREKKINVGKKQASASPLPPKDDASDPLTKSAPTLDIEAPLEVKPDIPKPVKKAVKKREVKKIITKKTFKVKVKAKSKVAPKLGKSILHKAKTSIAVKKALLKNGITKAKVVRKKPQPKQIVTKAPSEYDSPPVLEPMLPLEDNNTEKKPAKKKAIPKKMLLDAAASEARLNSISETIESIIQAGYKPKKPRAPKKLKTTNVDSVPDLEEVVRELASLIKAEDIKKEADGESSKKKTSKKPKVDGTNKKVKKVNIENCLGKVDTSSSNVIDMLDLNVEKTKNKTVVNRRHSIEKFPVTTQEEKVEETPIFTTLPRSISPKNKRATKMRQSLDSKQRHSPYTTRSDSPARMLRNGKQRKLKHLNLLEGLDASAFKKRRRLCSDYSGSEISVSKLSGYESDSSFSDMASLHGIDNPENTETASKELVLKKEILETLENNPEALDNKDMVENLAATIKRSLSVETSVNKETIDTNSNVCSEDVAKLEEETEVKNETYSVNEVTPSFKVPEKSVILGIMKQTFNEIVAEEQEREFERRKTRSSLRKSQKSTEDEAVVSTSQFYGSSIEKPIGSPDKTVDDQQDDKVVATATETIESQITTPEKMSDVLLENLHSSESIKNNSIEVKQNGDISPEPNISKPASPELIETPENLAIKNQILQALGLQSLQEAEEAKLKKMVPRNENYTGTLKTVIKLNRHDKKKGRNSLKLTLQKKGKSNNYKDEDLAGIVEDEYKIMKEGTSNWKSQSGRESSDTAGALRKSHYSNRSNMDASSEHTSDGDTNANEEGSGKLLVIPEKASSFSIHPGRLCKDECSYCFGKFGLFDTPCHIAQLKSFERQNKILSSEKHLTRDSCLCDACYRHVDRKSNTPSYTTNKSLKRNSLVAPGPRQNHCHVMGCGKIATNILKRKWIIKMRKSVCKVINIDLDNPGLHSIPICEEHYASLEHLMVCAMCKRRLARNHIHYLGTESNDLNTALNQMGIPVTLQDRPVVCKLCRYFATLLLKNPEDRNENSKSFFNEYRKRLLHFHDIEVMDEAQTEEPIPAPIKDKPEKEKEKDPVKKKKKVQSKPYNLEPPILEPQVEITEEKEPIEQTNRVPSTDSNGESPLDYLMEYSAMIPNIAIECTTDFEIKKDVSKRSSLSIKKISKPKSVEESLEKYKKFKNNSDIAVQRLGSNPSISVRQLFPGEEDLGLNGVIEFNNVKERTPEGWEKCISTIQYDPDTKMLWNELQKPYGNQSSFLRHLILLEKYFRNGDLVLSPNATHHSVNYTESVQNRLRAYDNIPSNVGHIQPLTMIPFNKPNKNSSSITKEMLVPTPQSALLSQLNAPKNLPFSFTSISVTPAPPQTSTPVSITPTVSVRPKLPPGLISLQPGTKIPVTSVMKFSQSQKIKFPITKNWRPNLIPIDPAKRNEKIPGLVQVISGGKPYHISLEDYKKMCAIKRTFDLRQKRNKEMQRESILKGIPSRKGLVISKTSALNSPPKTDSNSDQEIENSLEKLDKTVEKWEANLTDKGISIPKIPKSLTVIPQTITKKTSRPSSPSVLITPKTNPTAPTGKS